MMSVIFLDIRERHLSHICVVSTGYHTDVRIETERPGLLHGILQFTPRRDIKWCCYVCIAGVPLHDST